MTNLVLSKNYFNSQGTGRVMAALTLAPCKETLENVQLEEFNFDSNNSVIKLGELIAEAPGL